MVKQNPCRVKRRDERKQFEAASDGIFYYYARTPLQRDNAGKKVGGSEPIVTICFIVSGDNTYRGIAVCSVQDRPNMRRGRGIAFGRAWRAFRSGENSLPLDYDKNIKLQDTLLRCGKTMFDNFSNMFAFKSAVNPVLTQYEQRLVEGIKTQN